MHKKSLLATLSFLAGTAVLVLSQGEAQRSPVVLGIPGACPPLKIEKFGEDSALSNHPSVQVLLPVGYKLVGGGGDTGGKGQYLTGVWPQDSRTWAAASKDHILPHPGRVRAEAFGLYDPNNLYDVVIVQKTSEQKASHPQLAVSLPAGYQLLGGGAKTNWVSAGSLLTASHPIENGWFASAKDHEVAEPTTITVYAIGIKGVKCTLKGRPYIFNASGLSDEWGTAAQLSYETVLNQKGSVTSVGAKANWQMAGQMLSTVFGYSKVAQAKAYGAWQTEKNGVPKMQYRSPTVLSVYAVAWLPE